MLIMAVTSQEILPLLNGLFWAGGRHDQLSVEGQFPWEKIEEGYSARTEHSMAICTQIFQGYDKAIFCSHNEK